jgi:hypothetical protein
MVRLSFFNGKDGKIDYFWFGTVRAFCKKSKNGTLRSYKRKNGARWAIWRGTARG